MLSKEKNIYKIGVLLVNYNQWELTHSCILSLLSSVNVSISIALIDNNSSAPIPDWVHKIPNLYFFQNNTNKGLTAGNNKAYELIESMSEFVFILNNDTEVAKDALFLLAEQLRKNKNVGITVPAIPYAENQNIIWSAGGEYSYTKMSLKQKYKTIQDLPKEPIEMQQVTGCAMMMPKELYKEVGMQDPKLFIYYEDTDLCFRVENYKKKILLVPQAIVIHHVSISVGGVFSSFAVYFTHRNRYIVAKRYLKKQTFILFFFYYMFVTIVKTIIYPITNNAKLVPWMWLGLKHGLQNRPQIRPKGLFK